MFWLIGFAIIIFLTVRVMMLNDTVRKHERWIKKLNNEIQSIKEERSNEITTTLHIDEKIQVSLPDEEELNIQVKLNQAKQTQEKQLITNNVPSKKATLSKPSSNRLKTKRTFDLSKLSVESIISKLGMGLLLIGIGFIFKYAYDKGLITEQLTVVIGYVIGMILYIIGNYVKKKERLILSQVFIGGAIATFYMTTYAGFIVYALFGKMLALIILSAVTLWGFLTSIATNAQSTSVIAVVGGILIPFIVESEFLGILGISVYLAAVVLGSALIYFFKNWRVLQLTTIVSTYISLLVIQEEYVITSDIHIYYTLSVILVVVLTLSELVNHVKKRPVGQKYHDEISVGVLAGVPLLTVYNIESVAGSGVLTQSANSNYIVSSIYLLLSMYYGIATFISLKNNIMNVRTHALISITGLMSTLSFILYFDGIIRAGAILLLSTAIYFVNKKVDYKFSRIVAHIISAFGVMYAVSELTYIYGETFELSAFAGQMLVILVLSLNVSLQTGITRFVYGVMTYEIYLFFLLVTLLKNIVPSVYYHSSLIVVTGIWLILLQTLKERYRVLPKWSIEAIGGILIAIKLLYSMSNMIQWETELLEFGLILILAILYYSLGHFRYKDGKSRFIIKWSMVILVLQTLLVDVWIMTDQIQYGVLLVGLLAALIIKYDKEQSKWSVKARVLLIYVWIGIVFLSNLFMGVFALGSDTFDIVLLLLSLFELIVLFILHQKLTLSEPVKFILYSLLFFLLSFNGLQNLSGSGGTITLVWAGYALARLTYHMVMSQRKLANYALGLIVFVAVKYVVIDLSTVSVVWKIITSMIFGTALLALSYSLQPIMQRFDKNN